MLDLLTRTAEKAIGDDALATLQTWAHTVRLEHRAAANDVVGVLRWMTHQAGGRTPVGKRQHTRWIADDGETRPFPGLGAPPFLDAHWGVFEFDDARRLWVQAAIDAGDREPLAHTLWREAREHLISNASSCLIVGATAFEIGVKQHIRRMGGSVHKGRGGPGALELLHQGIPDLDQSRWQPLPKWLNKRLDAGIAARNAVVHEGASPPDTQSLLFFLRGVRDILLLLDYQWGKDGAMTYIDFPNGKDVQIVGLQPRLESPFPFD
jgi:hypothetical protein